jgi:preprotein translocase subunit SecY
MRAFELAPYAVASQGFVVQTSLALIAGSFMIHHCANTITAAGVGNGSTLVICMGIITGGLWAGGGGMHAVVVMHAIILSEMGWNVTVVLWVVGRSAATIPSHPPSW